MKVCLSKRLWVKSLQSLLMFVMELHQGCTMAPVLFSLYFGAVVDDWKRKCSTAGVEFRYELGHKLVGDRTRKSQLLHVASYLMLSLNHSFLMMLSCLSPQRKIL